MSKKTKEVKESKPSTTEQFQYFRYQVSSHLKSLESRINSIMELISTETIDEDNLVDSDVYFSGTHILRDGKAYKIKYVTEGYSLMPQDEGKVNTWKFKKGEDLVVEVEAETFEDAYMELKNRINASKNIEIVRG